MLERWSKKGETKRVCLLVCLFSFMEGHCRGEDMGGPGGDRIGVHDVKLLKNQ